MLKESSEAVDMSAQMKGFNPKEVKQVASEIIKAGAALYDALGFEPELREHRARAIAGHVDTDFVERSVMEAVAQVGDKAKVWHGGRLGQSDDVPTGAVYLSSPDMRDGVGFPLFPYQVEDHVRSLETQLDELERNEKTLDSKIEKKKQELERNEKRLSTLQSVRPAYMDEYERLQGELNELYGKVGPRSGGSDSEKVCAS